MTHHAQKSFDLKWAHFFLFLNFSTSFVILRPLGMSFLRLEMSRFFKGKACYNDTLVLGDWVLAQKPDYFQNKRDISKLTSAVL